MMASVILVVGFIGMIQAVTIGSEMLATARRQTIASQIINHEMERLRMADWTTITNHVTTTTWNSGSAYAVGNTVRYGGGWFTCIKAHSNQAPTNGEFWGAASSTYSGSRSYSLSDVVYYATNNKWYRYIYSSAASGNLPTSTTYWEEYTGPLTDSRIAGGVDFSVSRVISSPTADLREVIIVVSWTKGGTTTAASAATGSWLQRLSFQRETPIARTYTRSMTSWFTKYGLNHAIQRS